MTEDNQNNEFKPQPLPGQVFIRPGIDDRPDYEKTLTPEAKAAMRRLSVQQHPRIPEASGNPGRAHRIGRWSAPNRGRAS